MLRLLKAVLVFSIGLHALFYALQNVANLSAAKAALVYVMSGADHQICPTSLFFKTGSDTFAWVMLVVVLLGEFAIAFFGIRGGWELYRQRNAAADVFAEAKRAGVIAAGLALLVWFGFFMTFGAAFFQMWQTGAGSASMQGAFMYAMASVVTMLYVCLTPD